MFPLPLTLAAVQCQGDGQPPVHLIRVVLKPSSSLQKRLVTLACDGANYPSATEVGELLFDDRESVGRRHELSGFLSSVWSLQVTLFEYHYTRADLVYERGYCGMGEHRAVGFPSNERGI